QLLRLFGFDQAVVWRGVPAAVDRTAFWWSSPDGSTVRAEYLWTGYGNGAHLPEDPVALGKRVHAAIESVGPALAGQLLLMNGTDHQRAQSFLTRVVAEANAISDDVELIITSLPDALARSQATLGDGDQALPRWEGELRSGARVNLLMGVASNRLDLHQAAARAERSLERLAEPLSALWLAPEQWPGRLLELAWLEVVRNAAHDSSCACSADVVGRAVAHRYGEAADIGDGLTERALAAVAASQARPGAIVVNPCSRQRGGVVELTVPGEGPIAGGQVVEARPTVLTDRVMSAGETWSWMLGFRSQRINEGTYVNTAEVSEDDGMTVLTLHCEEELGENLGVDELKAEVNARVASRPGSPLHLRILQPPSRRVLWRMNDVPGFGWKRWLAAAPEAPEVRVSGSHLTNGLIEVAVDVESATFAIDGVAGLGRLIDSGDHGDTYNFSPPDHDLVIDRPETVGVEVLEAGPVRARLLMHADYRWPERIDDEARARVVPVDVRVATVVEVRAGEPFVRVHHSWDNRCRDHRVRAVLPLPAPARSSSAECAFAVVDRGLHAEGGPTERALATSFSRRFVRAGGLTVVHDGLLEYEMTSVSGASIPPEASSAEAISLTLLRATGMLSRVEMAYRPMPAGPPLRLEGAQCQGPVSATYAVCVDADIDPYALADDVLLPLRVAIGLGDGEEESDSGQALFVEGAEVSTLIRARGQLVLRVFNPHATAATVRLPGRSGWVEDLRGRPLSPFTGTVDLGPWQIATLRLDDLAGAAHP
ncbi:MAG TPA: hypothetical protein VNY84_10140, partial [Acidimicrobiales bacterium]|nr:hypothetical protein [Acidimicrobiales bacterium]